MKYSVIFGFDVIELENNVNIRLKEGWQLQGGVFIVRYGENDVCYYQAMIFS